MAHAKNYETMPKCVKVMAEHCRVFFPDTACNGY